MGFWNHRVVKRTYTCKDGTEETVIGIHEAHYNKEASPSGMPHSITEDPIAIVADTEEGLLETLELMKEAIKKEILNYSDF